LHLVSAAILARGGEEEFFADSPKAQEADAEFALHALSAVAFKLAFDGIANVSGYVLEVGEAIFVAGNARAIVFDAKKVASFFTAAGDRDRAGGGVYTVLDEFGNGFEGILLRKSDDVDGIPIIANAQAARIFHFNWILAKRLADSRVFIRQQE
jgi:hypothetical protein